MREKPLSSRPQRTLPLSVSLPLSLLDDKRLLAERAPLSLSLSHLHLLCHWVSLEGSTRGGAQSCSVAELTTDVSGRSLSQKLGLLTPASARRLPTWYALQT